MIWRFVSPKKGNNVIMPTNNDILECLFQNEKIDLRRGKIFDTTPKPVMKDLEIDKVEGMMLGLAIGDALGNTTEGMLPTARKRIYGEIRDYLPNRHADNERIGLPTDDTQLAFWTLEQMIADKGFNPENVVRRFSQDRIFGIGQTVRGFLANLKSGEPWYECGPKSAGNGALMRIAPIVYPHLRSCTSDLWVDTTLCAMMTHNDTASISACIWFVWILWNLLQTDTTPEASWWLESYSETVTDLETDSKYSPRGGYFQDYEGSMRRYVAERVTDAWDRNQSVLEACNSWYSGAYLMETVPAVIYILMKHGHDPEEAILRSVNDTKDNDTIAPIVGAAVGALHGKNALPKRWINNLSGRTSSADDGRVFELLDSAQRLWY